MFDQEVEKVLKESLEDFEQEVMIVYSQIVKPCWNSNPKRFYRTLYAYVMTCFALIDLFSSYWRGNGSTHAQRQRMTDFMETYLSYPLEAIKVAIQIWRHKLMHTGEPRPLTGNRTGKVYRWLLHWSDELPREQHFTFQEASDSRILNMGLVYLISDLKMGALKYLEELKSNTNLQRNWIKFKDEMTSYQFQE